MLFLDFYSTVATHYLNKSKWYISAHNFKQVCDLCAYFIQFQ